MTPVILHGDVLDVLPTLADASIDAIVCDPPYALGFMGHAWDTHTPQGFQAWCQAWAAECLRVLKPGGHLLAFGGTRTVHRLTSGIEDAGFEIRDGIDWLYGSGFPKSLDVSKALDAHGRGQMRRAKLAHFIEARDVSAAWLIERGVADAKSFADWTSEDHAPSDRNWRLIRDALQVTGAEEEAYERSVIGRGVSGATAGMQLLGPSGITGGTYDITAPATDAARHWSGWGTALKPAREPIVVARKPLNGAVAANVQQYGTGALNINASRTGGPAGRWPTNVIMSHIGDNDTGNACIDGCVPGCPVAELGEPSRFYPVFRYQAKAPARERPKVDGVSHSTVKPLALMRWLVRLVTPPGGHVLDPFAGSGTTVEACLLEGYTVTAVEKHGPYLPLIDARIARVTGGTTQ